MTTFAQQNVSDIPVGAAVIDTDGERAEVLGIDRESPQPVAALRMEHGRIVRVSTDMLQRNSEGVWTVAFSLALLASESASGERDGGAEPEAVAPGAVVVPVVQEKVEIKRRTVDKGTGIRVAKSVSQHEQVVDVPLEHDELEVTRVAVDRTLAAGEQAVARQEGDTLIVPVLEEVLVVEKRWRVKEEVHITRHRREAHAAHRVVLRSETVTAERFDENESGIPASKS